MKGYKASPLAEAHNPDAPEGWNAENIEFIMAITPPGRADINDVPEMERRFAHYIEMCIKYNKKISNLSAYAAIGITKNQVWDWINVNKSNPERTDFAKKVQSICSTYREQMMADSKVNPVIGIFWQKNYDGLRDQTEIQVTPTTGIEAESQEKLAEKYLGRLETTPVIEDKNE